MKRVKPTQKDKEKGSYLFAIISFCLCITLIFLPLYLFKDFIQSIPFWFQPIIIIIFGTAGIGLYVLLGFKLREIELKLNCIQKTKHINQKS